MFDVFLFKGFQKEQIYFNLFGWPKGLCHPLWPLWIGSYTQNPTFDNVWFSSWWDILAYAYSSTMFQMASIDNNRHRCWPARNSRLTQRETNHNITCCASVLAWSYLAGSSPEQLFIDLFALHQQFAVCCSWPYIQSTAARSSENPNRSRTPKICYPKTE